MKIILTFTLFTIFISISLAQKPAYEWIRTAQGSSYDEALAIACDNNGNSISTGYFEGSFTIGDSTFISDTYADIFLIKHEENGNLMWAKHLACQVGWGNSVLLDDNGNTILSGFFSDSIRINDFVYQGYSVQTAFIAKFDQAGNILWFNIMGGENGWILTSDLMFLNNGDIICSGISNGTVLIGDTLLTPNEMTSFLVRYSPTGDFIKLIEICSGFTNASNLGGIACDNLDNMYIGGSFRSGLTFSDTNITAIGFHDIFIAKFDNQGSFLWVRQEGNMASHIGLDVAADQQGNSAITGYFSGSMNFGDTTLTALGSEDIFIVKYDPSGNFLWARNAGGNKNFDLDEGNGIVADAKGNFYVTGTFEGLAFFGDTTLTSSGSTDIFCAKYDTDANCIWATKVGGSGEERGDDIALNTLGDIFLTGWYSSNISFGDTLITHTDITDVLVIKLTESEISAINISPDYVQQYMVYQNYPNPFNPSTSIEFSIPASMFVELKIYNIEGQEIATLVSNKLISGNHKYTFDGKNLASGVYFYQLVAGDFREVKKMILLR